MTNEYDSIWPINVGHVSVDGQVPTLRRVLSGLYSLDQCLASETGGSGIPLRGGIEIYGKWETGKSTLAYFLAGRISQSWGPESRRIALVDLEGGAREEYLRSSISQSGFEGTVYRVPFNAKGQPRNHEDMLQEGADLLLEDDVRCVILDSAAMTQPISEREGEMEEAFMGRRAQVLAKFSRRCLAWINSEEEDKLFIVVNHMLQDMGGYGKISPGGDTLKFGINARLWIKRADASTPLPSGAFEAEIAVEKLRFGGKNKDRKGRVVILPEVGVSPELTAAFDCMELKLARRQAGTGMVQYLGADGNWVDVDLLKNLIVELLNGKGKEAFQPFYDILKRQ